MKETRMYHVVYERNDKGYQYTVDHATLTKNFDDLLKNVDWLTIDLISKKDMKDV